MPSLGWQDSSPSWQAMPAPHVVPLTPSVSLRLSQFSCHKQTEQSIFHSPYTLPSSASRKSFACHSYENCRGVYQQFPFWSTERSQEELPTRHSPLHSFLFLASARFLPAIALTPLDATLMDHPASVTNKRLTDWLTPLDATFTKNRGCYTGRHRTQMTAHQSRVTSHCHLRHRSAIIREET